MGSASQAELSGKPGSGPALQVSSVSHVVPYPHQIPTCCPPKLMSRSASLCPPWLPLSRWHSEAPEVCPYPHHPESSLPPYIVQTHLRCVTWLREPSLWMHSEKMLHEHLFCVGKDPDSLLPQWLDYSAQLFLKKRFWPSGCFLSLDVIILLQTQTRMESDQFAADKDFSGFFPSFSPSTWITQTCTRCANSEGQTKDRGLRIWEIRFGLNERQPPLSVRKVGVRFTGSTRCSRHHIPVAMDPSQHGCSGTEEETKTQRDAVTHQVDTRWNFPSPVPDFTHRGPSASPLLPTEKSMEACMITHNAMWWVLR